jgi:hypothetical protein
MVRWRPGGGVSLAVDVRSGWSVCALERRLLCVPHQRKEHGTIIQLLLLERPGTEALWHGSGLER